MGTIIIKLLCVHAIHMPVKSFLYRPHILALLYAGEQQHTNSKLQGSYKGLKWASRYDCVNVEQ